MAIFILLAFIGGGLVGFLIAALMQIAGKDNKNADKC